MKARGGLRCACGALRVAMPLRGVAGCGTVEGARVDEGSGEFNAEARRTRRLAEKKEDGLRVAGCAAGSGVEGCLP